MEPTGRRPRSKPAILHPYLSQPSRQTWSSANNEPGSVEDHSLSVNHLRQEDLVAAGTHVRPEHRTDVPAPSLDEARLQCDILPLPPGAGQSVNDVDLFRADSRSGPCGNALSGPPPLWVTRFIPLRRRPGKERTAPRTPANPR